MPAKTANIYARIEPSIKEEAEAILSELGISASSAINIFYKQIILRKGLPFDVRIPEQPAPGEIAAEQAAPGETVAEQEAPGETAAEQAAPGEIAAEQAAPGGDVTEKSDIEEKKWEEKYYEYLISRISVNDLQGRSFHKLLRYLHTLKFIPGHKMDENRAADGRYLRKLFALETGYEGLIEGLGECSMLEMMLVVAEKVENMIASPDYANKMVLRFYDMVASLGLSQSYDENFDAQYVNNVVEKFLWNQYSKNGKGGLFYCPGTRRDFRNMEIWWQMQYYSSWKAGFVEIVEDGRVSDDMPENILNVENREQFREWLMENHLRARECWALVKKGRPVDEEHFWYLDAVEEALCFGWIDSSNAIIEGKRMQRFTPRKKGSLWTELNKERVRRLEKLDLMTDAGRAVLPPMGPRSFKIDKRVENDLKRARVWTKFKKFPPLYQRVRAYNAQFNLQKLRYDYYKSYMERLIENTRQEKMYGDWNDYGRLL